MLSYSLLRKNDLGIFLKRLVKNKFSPDYHNNLGTCSSCKCFRGFARSNGRHLHNGAFEQLSRVEGFLRRHDSLRAYAVLTDMYDRIKLVRKYDLCLLVSIVSPLNCIS